MKVGLHIHLRNTKLARSILNIKITVHKQKNNVLQINNTVLKNQSYTLVKSQYHVNSSTADGTTTSLAEQFVSARLTETLVATWHQRDACVTLSHEAHLATVVVDSCCILCSSSNSIVVASSDVIAVFFVCTVASSNMRLLCRAHPYCGSRHAETAVDFAVEPVNARWSWPRWWCWSASSNVEWPSRGSVFRRLPDYQTSFVDRNSKTMNLEWRLMLFSEREWVTQYCPGEFTFYLLQQEHFTVYYIIWRDVVYSKDYPDLRYATSATTLRPANANAIPNQLQSHIYIYIYIYLPISQTATNSQRKRTVNNRQRIS